MTRSRSMARGLLAILVGAGLLSVPLVLTFSWAGAAPAPQARLATTTGTAAYSPGGRPVSFRSGPLQAPADHIVISELRSRGPSPNGHDSDEFVELFNPTGAAIDISGWSLWLSGSCAASEAPLLTIPAAPASVLGPGHHYLIAGQNYSGVVPANFTYSIGLADDGGIALFDGPSNITNNRVDAVGMCNTTTYFEGTPLAPVTLNSDWSYDRIADTSPGGACTDTNVNAADFFFRTPSDPQNTESLVSACGNPTPAPSATPVPPSRTPTATRTPIGSRQLVINEVGWAGTRADANDQWIELYNPGAAAIDLTGWSIESPTTGLVINLVGSIPAGQYFLLVHGSAAEATATPATAPACTVFQSADVHYDQVFSGKLLQTGQILYLIDPVNRIQDTADRTGGAWPAGKLDPASSMERTGPPAVSVIPADSSTAWFTYADAASTSIHDCSGNGVYGTPRHANWAFTVTTTPSPTPAPTKKPTPRPPTPFAHMVINEFLPRAGTDWNGDGSVDVYDEFIEIKNLGPIDVNLRNWKLDGDPHLGSTPFLLTGTKLKVGQRAVFYGSTTHILLHDSGDTVRLLNPAGVVIDARGYGPVADTDHSTCRIPDGYYWRFPCFPTPGNENKLTGSAPAPAPKAAIKPPPCLLADTVPDPFRLAECAGYGGDMWSRSWWDDQAGFAVFPAPDVFEKWHSLVQ